MISLITYYLNDYWDTISDPRTAPFPFVSIGIWKLLTVMISYLILTRFILSSYMKNRKPYILKWPMFGHNMTMVVLNAYIFMEAVSVCQWGKIFLNFNYPDQSDRSPLTMHTLRMEWFFWMTRFMDLFDTFFHVLRKKESHVTFLHLYHHTIVPIICWLCLKANPLAPIVLLFGVCNSMIHVLMYLYYALAAFGPEIRRYLWWKKYLTLMQIAQFVICGSYGIILFFLHKGYPMGWFYFTVGQNPIFFYMFYDFYRKSYKEKVTKNGHLN